MDYGVFKLEDVKFNIPQNEKGKDDYMKPWTFTSEKVLIDEYREGVIDRELVDKMMKEADIHFILSEDDPKPYKHMNSLYSKAKKLREETLRKQAEEAAAQN